MDLFEKAKKIPKVNKKKKKKKKIKAKESELAIALKEMK